MANLGKQQISSRQKPKLVQQKSVVEQGKFPEVVPNVTAPTATTDLSDYHEPESGEMIANVMGSLSTAKPSSPSSYVASKQLQAPKRQDTETNIAPVNQLKALPRQNMSQQAAIQGKEEMAENGQVSSAEDRPNHTGLPNNLKAGVENLSGYSLDNVRVHYNSPKPAQLQALAYTQGTEIHVAPGQEKHIPHETWHVVQQMQGRVKPTMQMKDFNVNADSQLEIEADVMGETALKMSSLTSRFPTAAQSEQSRSLLGQPPAALQHIQSTSPVRQFICGPAPKTEAALINVARGGNEPKPSFSCHNTVHYWLVKAGYANEETFPANHPQDYQNAFYTGVGNPVRTNGNLVAPPGKIIVMYDMATGEIMHSMVSLSAGQWIGHNNVGTFGTSAPFTGIADLAGLGATWWDGTGNILYNQKDDLGPRNAARLRIIWMNPSDIGANYQAT